MYMYTKINMHNYMCPLSIHFSATCNHVSHHTLRACYNSPVETMHTQSTMYMYIHILHTFNHLHVHVHVGCIQLIASTYDLGT